MSLRLEPEDYRALWKSVLERDEYKCRNPRCGMRNGLSVHHIIFKSELGPDESWNMVTLCNLCHDAVHAYKLFIGVGPDCAIGVGGGADSRLIFTGEFLA